MTDILTPNKVGAIESDFRCDGVMAVSDGVRLFISHRAQAAKIEELAKENMAWRMHAGTPQKVAECGTCGEDITQLTINMASGVLVCGDCTPPEDL